MTRIIMSDPDVRIAPTDYCYGCKRAIYGGARTTHTYMSPSRRMSVTFCPTCEQAMGADFQRIFDNWRRQDEEDA